MEKQNVFSVADYFIRNIGKKSRVDNLKLNKLVYIAFGFSISKQNIPLFDEEIQAWQYGPVIPVLYHHFKSHKSENIEDPSNKGINIEKDSSEGTIKILKLVKDIYESKEGLEMVELTHQPKTPWSYSYNGSGKNPIDKSVIKEYYDIFISNLNQDKIREALQ